MEEDEGRKKKASMEVELEQLERQRQEVRRNMDEIDRKLDQVIRIRIASYIERLDRA